MKNKKLGLLLIGIVLHCAGGLGYWSWMGSTTRFQGQLIAAVERNTAADWQGVSDFQAVSKSLVETLGFGLKESGVDLPGMTRQMQDLTGSKAALMSPEAMVAMVERMAGKSPEQRRQVALRLSRSGVLRMVRNGKEGYMPFNTKKGEVRLKFEKQAWDQWRLVGVSVPPEAMAGFFK